MVNITYTSILYWMYIFLNISFVKMHKRSLLKYDQKKNDYIRFTIVRGNRATPNTCVKQSYIICRGLTNMFERGSLNMYQSGESLMRMSPPSLVSSLLMDSSGTFNHESMDSRKLQDLGNTLICWIYCLKRTLIVFWFMFVSIIISECVYKCSAHSYALTASVTDKYK